MTALREKLCQITAGRHVGSPRRILFAWKDLLSQTACVCALIDVLEPRHRALRAHSGSCQSSGTGSTHASLALCDK